jgi:hypothetical protein
MLGEWLEVPKILVMGQSNGSFCEREREREREKKKEIKTVSAPPD